MQKTHTHRETASANITEIGTTAFLKNKLFGTK